jgi:hypothetical protein
MGHEVFEWINTRGGDIRVVLEVEFNVEVRDGTKLTGGSIIEVMRQRALTSG